jgi:hypothetical protein
MLMTRKTFWPIEDYLQNDPWDRPVEPEAQARFESWVAAEERQAEADFQSLIGMSIQDVPEPQFEGFHITVNKDAALWWPRAFHHWRCSGGY